MQKGVWFISTLMSDLAHSLLQIRNDLVASKLSDTVKIEANITCVIGIEFELCLFLSRRRVYRNNFNFLRIYHTPFELKIRFTSRAVGVKLYGLALKIG